MGTVHKAVRIYQDIFLEAKMIKFYDFEHLMRATTGAVRINITRHKAGEERVISVTVMALLSDSRLYPVITNVNSVVSSLS